MSIPGINYFCERHWTLTHEGTNDLNCWVCGSIGNVVDYEFIRIGPNYTIISFSNSHRLRFIRLKQKWEF